MISGPFARVVESVGPVVTITTATPAQSSNKSAAFAFTASDNVTTPGDLVVEAQLDGGPSAPASGR